MLMCYRVVAFFALLICREAKKMLRCSFTDLECDLDFVVDAVAG